jgi:ABC-type xylose transport system permease subunit
LKRRFVQLQVRRGTLAAVRDVGEETSGTILGALILTVLDSLLTILNASQAVRQIVYGLIVLSLAAIYARASASD